VHLTIKTGCFAEEGLSPEKLTFTILICTPHISALTKVSLPDIMANDNVVQSRDKKLAIRIGHTYQMTTVNGIDS
jgi:hypothetical protein